MAERRQIWFRGRDASSLRELIVEVHEDEVPGDVTSMVVRDDSGGGGPFEYIYGLFPESFEFGYRDSDDYVIQNMWFRMPVDVANAMVTGQALLGGPGWHEHFSNVWRPWGCEGCLLSPRAMMRLIDGLGPRDVLRTVEEYIGYSGPQRCVMIIRRLGYDRRTLKVTGYDTKGSFVLEGSWYASLDLFDPAICFTREREPVSKRRSATGYSESTMSEREWEVHLNALKEVRLNGRTIAGSTESRRFLPCV